MTENKTILSKVDFMMLSFLIVVSISLAVLAYSFGGVDFGVYYAAGRVFLQGGNPYDYSQLIGEVVSATGISNNPYYYAPWFTWGLSLFALFPYQTAKILWAVINFGFWFWGLFNLSKLIAWPSPGWRQSGMYLYLTFVFAWATWGSEQVGVLIFLILTFALLAHKDKKWLPMGIWMALILFKPNITVIPVSILAVWLILRGNWKPVIAMAGSLLLMIFISLIISPGWYLELLQPDKVTGLSYTLNESGAVEIYRYTTTLPDWLSAYGITGMASYALYAIFSLMGILLVARMVYRSQAIIQLIAVAVWINFALIPYALFYDYPALSLTLLYVNFNFSQKPGLVWAQRIMNLLILASLFIGDNISHRYWIVVLILLFATLSGTFMIQKEAAPDRSSLLENNRSI